MLLLRNALRPAVCAGLLALCFGTMAVHAQSDRQPWQATLTKTGHAPGATKLYMDLPLPPTGRTLTIERVGVILGPTGSIYGKLERCTIESNRPKLAAAEFLENRTRFLLPLPIHLGAGTKTFAIILAPVLLYAEASDFDNRESFRVVCDTDAIAASDPFTVSLAGYTTAK